MNIFSKFGICLICMLALVLLAVTPNTAASDDIVGSLYEPVPTSLPQHQQGDPRRSFAFGVNTVTVQNHDT